MDEGFVSDRYKYANQCPCGESNKKRHFSPFKGQEPDGNAKYGKCHKCDQVFLPPLDKEDSTDFSKTQKYISPEVMNRSLEQVEKSVLFKYLSGKFDINSVRAAFLRNFVGAGSEGSTVFWLVDSHGRVCQPKQMWYKEDGHRDKNKMPRIPDQYKSAHGYYPSCSFNEVNAVNDERPIGIVESEKTALMCEILFPELVWISGGGANGMSQDKRHPIRGRAALIFYDADEAGRTAAGKLSHDLIKIKCNVRICDPFAEETKGYDMGDFIDDYHNNDDQVDWMRKYINGEIDKLTNNSVLDYEAGVYRVSAQKEYLLHTFRNGKKKGETTHMIELDENFKWKKTFIYTITGYPNSGKSEALLFMAMLKSKYDGWKWLMYVPESMSSHEGSMTVDEVVDTLAHIYIGQSTDPENPNQMSEPDYLKAIDFIDEHFVFIYPPDGFTTPETLLSYTKYVIDNWGIDFDGMIIDPWNNMRSDQKPNEMIDDYIMRELIGIKHFLIVNNLVGCIVVHPNSKNPVNKDGSVPPAGPHTLRGGAAFYNKSDAILSVHRPDWFMDTVTVEINGEPREISGRNSTKVEFHTFKMKNQKLVGAVLGFSTWHFNRRTNRYENEYRLSPLDEAYRKGRKWQRTTRK